jgi:hypothetical protein
LEVVEVTIIGCSFFILNLVVDVYCINIIIIFS